MATLPEGRRSSDGIQTLSVFSIGDTVHIGYADRLVEVICQEQHLLKTDLFEGVNVQSVACVCVCACVWALRKLSGLQCHHSYLAASLLF